jgi:hypothetical protein
MHWLESNVFRGAVFSIVLALTGSPVTALLCRTWCDPNGAAASGCHHEELVSFTVVTGEDACRNAVVNVTALVQEDVRRGMSSVHARHAIPVPTSYELAGWTANADIGYALARSPSLGNRPLHAPLRI